MLNEKMYAVAIAIEETIIEKFPVDYQVFVFGGIIKLNDIISQILVECCKYAFDNTIEKRSLKQHLTELELSEKYEEAERMKQQRTIGYIQERRQFLYEYLKQSGPVDDGLKAPNMKDMENKLSGYQLNDFQFWEINNIHNMQMVKAIVDRRIFKDNFKKDTFRIYSDEYDETIARFKNECQQGSEKLVFNSLSMFTLAWKYSFDFYYEIVDEMERCNVAEIPDMERRISAFCGLLSIDSILRIIDPVLGHNRIRTEGRMIVQRRKYVHDIVTQSANEFEIELSRYAEGIYLKSILMLHMTYCKVAIREWFIKNTSYDDWASVFQDYDVFQCHIQQKDWTNKKVRFAKKIYDNISFDYKNPDFRS